VSDKKVRIIPKHREIDFERLASALLDLAASLTPEECEEYGARGSVLRKEIEAGIKRRKKGSTS